LIKEEYTDDYISRWFVARAWDVEDAVDLFTNSMTWRKENDVDNILEWYPLSENYKKMWEYWPCSKEIYYTKEGWPVYYERIGIVDFQHLFTIVTAKDLVNFHIFEAEKREKMRLQMEKEKGFTVGTVFIHDYTNLGMRHMNTEALSVINKLSQIDQYNYPESVRKSFEINTPIVFNMLFNIVAKLLDPGLVAKLIFYSNDFKDHLLSFIPEDQLPDWAGGTRENVCFGGDLFIQKLQSEGIKLEVPASKSISVLIDVKKDSMVDWRFVSDTHDIEFYINYHKESSTETISKHGRTKSGVGSFVAQEGTYSLVFDNNYSWTRKKSVTYQFLIIENQPN